MAPALAPHSTLAHKIRAAQTQMRSKLEEARATFEQGGDKGAAAEDAFRAFLRGYLPRRLGIGHGEVIDSTGGRSRQTDVIIATEDHPFTFTQDVPGLFFIEGVCAAGEVKSVLTASDLETMCLASKQFKELKLSAGKGTTILTNSSDRDRFYKCPPWFLAAYESRVNLPTVKEYIEGFVQKNGLDPVSLVDAIFVFDEGWLINFGDGQGSFQLRTPEGTPVGGWACQKSDLVLFDLLAWLSLVMPRMIRYEPILAPYLVAADSGPEKPAN